jgi:hypothetical protein
MNLDLYYVVKELRFSGKVEEHEYASGPFKSWSVALDEKLERNAAYGVDTFQIVKHSIEVDLK